MPDSVFEQPELLSGADSTWIRVERPENQMAIVGILFLNPEPEFEAVVTLLKKRLLVFNRFRQKLVFRGEIPSWEPDPDFDIYNHVKYTPLSTSDEGSLQKLIGRLMERSMDFSRPLWEIYLVPGTTDGCGLVVKLHHCIADGIALVQVLLSLATVSPDGPYFRPGSDFQSTRSGKKTSGMTELIHSAMRETGLILSGFIKLLTMSPDQKTPLKGALNPPKVAVWSKPTPLETIKLTGRKYKVTVNDVLLWFTCNAIREYLKERQGNAPEGFSRVAIPVNLRPANQKPGLGNRFGLAFIELPIGEPDAIVRLRSIQRQMREIKGSREAVAAYLVLRSIGWAPESVKNWVLNFFSSKATAVVTNVPGPKKALYIAGSEMERIMFWVPMAGKLGLGVSLISYNNSVMLGLAADAGLVSDPENLIHKFNKQIEKASREFDSK